MKAAAGKELGIVFHQDNVASPEKRPEFSHRSRIDDRGTMHTQEHRAVKPRSHTVEGRLHEVFVLSDVKIDVVPACFNPIDCICIHKEDSTAISNGDPLKDGGLFFIAPVSELFQDGTQTQIEITKTASTYLLDHPIEDFCNMLLVWRLEDVVNRVHSKRFQRVLIVGGNKKGFEATFRSLTYAYSPNVFSFIPFCGGYIALVWQIVIIIIGFKETHQIPTWKAIVACLLPLILCCVCGLVLVIIAGAAIFSAIQSTMPH